MRISPFPARKLLLSLVLALPLLATPVHNVLPEEDSCSAIIQQALRATDQLCNDANRNEACYGHALLDARPQPYVDQFLFAAEGDIVGVDKIQTLRLQAMDIASNAWGVALMRLQANLPDAQPRQNVTLLLFGDVELGNGMSHNAMMTVTPATTTNVIVRQQPSQFSLIVGAVEPGETVTATGRLDDSSWVRVIAPKTGETGWIASWLLSEQDTIGGLDIVDPSTRFYGPMQAVTFRSGMNDAQCSEAPDSGILIQTPEGQGKVTFLINEVDIQLGSTVYFQAEPGQNMIVRTVEGSARVTAQGVTNYALAGMQVSVPLDENLRPSGPPSLPTAYDMADVAALPVTHLPRAVEIHAPATGEELRALLQPVATPADVSNTSSQDRAGDESGLATEGENPASDGTTTADQPAADQTSEPPAQDPQSTEDQTTEPEEEQVVICHKGSTITVAASAVPAHLDHGDTLGPCP